MKIIYPSFHFRHRPPAEIFNGKIEPHAEVPERIEHIRTVLESQPGIKIIAPKRFPQSHIESVHDSAYVRYLAEAGRLAGDKYLYPSVFPYVRHGSIKNIIARRGLYTFDMYTPINNTTYKVSWDSAMAALTASSLVRQGDKISYALCRPPGHHAERSRMGGYCYFNNAAIAANYLSKYGSVAVFDIDVHHGNGTQHIFYERNDVLVVNIHADPAQKFPYFSGGVSEKGAGKGVGYNYNFPLPTKTSDFAYERVFRKALRIIKKFDPHYLVVSIGYDAHIDDPIGGFSLSTVFYGQMASQLSMLNIQTVLVQEGGYNTSKLGVVAKNFVSGFMNTN